MNAKGLIDVTDVLGGKRPEGNGRRDTRTDDHAGATMAKLYCAA